VLIEGADISRVRKERREEGTNKIAFTVSMILTALMLLSIAPVSVSAASPRHCKGLDVYFYASNTKAFQALLAGEVDFIQWPLTHEQYLDACASPYLSLAGYAENGMVQFDVNNNYTIADYPGVRSPTNDVNFRKAIAQAVDKDWIVNTVIEGFAERIDCPLCAPQKNYGSASCCNENTYPYDLDAANARLDAAGFDDRDHNGVRNYPVGWDGAAGGGDLAPLKVYVRSDDPHRLAAGAYLVGTLTNDLHVPVTAVYDTSDVEFPIVMGDRNYHIYTSSWSLGRYPSYLYGLFHSDNWYPNGANYVTGMNKINEPNYPDLDEVLDDVYHTSTIPEFVTAVDKATELLVCKYCVNIPLWSYKDWWAYSKYLEGVVNEDGCGLENTYTFLNAYKVDNPDTPLDDSKDPIRMGTIHAPNALNMLCSTWYFDYAVLNRLSGSLLSVNPYNLAVDQPWIAQDWQETTWYDPQDGETKTKVTYWIRQDVWWHDPVTGQATHQFTAHDIDFSIWYIYPHTTVWNWGMAKDVHHTHVIDDFTIEVYFDSLSMFHKYAPTTPLLCKSGLLDLLCREQMCELPIAEARVPSDKDILPCDTIVQIISATKYPGGTPLVEGLDYEIFGTGAPDYCRQEIHWLIPLASGDSVVFSYWCPDQAPTGYYLGGLTWQQTLYSTGPYYVTDIAPGENGYATMNCVDSHFIGAPPLGEIDWTWYWVPGPYPRSGYYQVQLFDAVKLLAAYCSRGDGVPNANWCPAADIDGYDLSHVGLFDAVQLLQNYGKKFGEP
jgi:ABC-type transport system substrate-binding protein